MRRLGVGIVSLVITFIFCHLLIEKYEGVDVGQFYSGLVNTIKTSCATNKTTSQRKLFVFINRVFKTGSSTLVEIVTKLSKRNNFNTFFSTNHNQAKLDQTETVQFQDWVTTFEETTEANFDTTLFLRFMNFVDLGNVRKDVVYISLLRDPVSRFESEFNYKRQVYFGGFLNHEKICFDDEKYESFLKDIKESWMEQNLYSTNWWNYPPKLSHYINRTQYLHYDLKLQNLMLKEAMKLKCIGVDVETKEKMKREFGPWLQKSLASCATNKSDPECHDFSERRENRNADFADIFMERRAGHNNLRQNKKLFSPPILFPSAVNYFCASAPGSNEEGGAEAMATMDKHYTVVAVLEMMEKSLAVLENKLPRVFEGAMNIYKDMKKRGKSKKNAFKHQKADEETKKILEENLKGEYKLYNHAVKQLEYQYNHL